MNKIELIKLAMQLAIKQMAQEDNISIKKELELIISELNNH